MYGYNQSRYTEYKRAVEDKNIGPLIKTSMTRCIHCTRCVRFTEQIGGEYSLGQVARGNENEISTYVENLVTHELSGNVVDLCPVGALNNLPYSFTARPWELKSNYSVDVFDALASPIDVHTRGSDTMRILPRVHEHINEEWISDKSRHAFDALKKQRLTFPMARRADGTYAELKWDEALSIAARKLGSVRGDEIKGMIGPHVDVETATAFKDLLNRLNCENIDVRQDAALIDSDFRPQYLMNSRVTGIDDTDLLLMVGCNPRSENPVLNARIRKAYMLNGLEVACIGSAPDLSYDFIHLGNSTKILEELADGTHPYSERLSKAELPMLLVSSHIFERSDAEGLHSVINKLSKKYKVINEAESWNGLSVLHNEVSRPGLLDIGIESKRSTSKPSKLVWLQACDDFRNSEIPEDSFVIYQGHIGDEGAYYADLILPGASYLEKQGTFVNLDGRPQQSRAAQAPPGHARDDWMIIRAISEELGTPLPYDSLDELRTRIAGLAPHIIKFDHIESSGFEDLAVNKTQGGAMNATPFTDSVDNFFMTDAVSRNSSMMARCTKEINPKKLANFRGRVVNWITH